MAPKSAADEAAEQAALAAEHHLKDIISRLYNLIVQTSQHAGSSSTEASRREIKSLIQNLLRLSQTAPSVQVYIPPEVISYVESSRNPDIFTREFVETVQRMNQMLNGRADAYRMLQEQIAWQLTSVIPEMKDDIRKVVESTGGKVPT